MGMQQMCDSLMDVKLRIANPGLGQQPVPRVIAGQEDGVVWPGSLFELVDQSSRESGSGSICHPLSGTLCTLPLPLSPAFLQTWMAMGSRGPDPELWCNRVIGAAEN
jgi:hypothetical protein